jgi:hypothetical protein
MASTPQDRLRVFAFKAFVRFARRFHLSDEAIWDVVRGPYDADLGVREKAPEAAAAHWLP